MEEPDSTNACKISYDDGFNNLSRNDVKFRRCYGSVKLNPREAEEAELGEDFAGIIDSIQEVEDVFLTRECNNFDLINLDSSEISLPLNTFGDELDKEHLGKESRFVNLLKSDADSEGKLFNSKDSTESKEALYDCIVNPEEDSCYSFTDNKTDFMEVASDPVLVYCKNEKLRKEIVKTNSCSRELGRKHTEMSFRRNSSSSNEYEHGRQDAAEDLDSDDSSRWGKRVDDSKSDLFNLESPSSERFTKLSKYEADVDLSEDSSSFLGIDPASKTSNLSDTGSNVRETVQNDTFDNDSLKSQGTSHSGSSTFESAMSSNDMMSPFGTPRNSQTKQSSFEGVSKVEKKAGIDYAKLTSENIPNTLNRISLHRAIEKSFLENKTPNKLSQQSIIDKKDQDSNQNIADYNKVHSSHSIRKLLNLTSHKKSTHPNEQRGPDKLPSKKNTSNENELFRKDSLKTISLKNRDKKINIKEFYLSRRSKLKKLIETNSSLRGDQGNSYDDDDSDWRNDSCVSTSRSENESCQNEKTCYTMQTAVAARPSLSSENKFKNSSKIPRPVSRKESTHRSVPESGQESSCNLDLEDHVREKRLTRTLSANPAINTERSDISETLSRRSDGSDISTKGISSPLKYKEEKAHKIASKLTINNSQIDSLRSKYWKRGDKITIPNSPGKNEEKTVANNDKKKVRSNIYMPPQPVRQESRVYSKLVRVKTAPNKSTVQTRDKSLGREQLKHDLQRKPGRKPSKVVSIGALDVKKYH